MSSVFYTYGNSSWGDQLTAYDGTTISYDASGNPLNWRNALSLTWNGRELSEYRVSSTNFTTFNYNVDGIRTQKRYVDSYTHYASEHNYVLDGTKIVREQIINSTITSQTTNTLNYYYDANDSVIGFNYNGTDYYYRKNLQGDIIAILNTSGTKVVEYTYNAWGEVLSLTGSLANTIGQINPFRYRGYYYDTETGLYYLQSRYYDPVVGRFLNADDESFILLIDAILDTNIYAYCLNEPIFCCDPYGHKAGIGYMGIMNASDLPSGSYISYTILNAGKVSWGTTGLFRSFAKNHCAAVAVYNLVFYFYSIGYNRLPSFWRGNVSIYDTFMSVHYIVGDGPVMTIAGKAKKYFKNKGYNLKYKSTSSLRAVLIAIILNRPVGILISSGLFSWHWIICVGFRKYENGDIYLQVVDGWNNTIERYYRPYYGSSWISGTQYWIV